MFGWLWRRLAGQKQALEVKLTLNIPQGVIHVRHHFDKEGSSALKAPIRSGHGDSNGPVADPSTRTPQDEGTRPQDLPIDALFKDQALPEVQLGTDTDGK